jgi:hypothetical protein
MTSEGQEPEPSGEDFAALQARGTRATGEYHCVTCGYGITLHSRLPRCPMCGGESWEQTPWSPFVRAFEHAQ